MIERILGNGTAEKVLFYLTAYQEGYAGGIANAFGMPINMVQKQLARFEEAGLLASNMVGRTRLYVWNPDYPFLKEFRAFMDKAFELIPEDDKELFYGDRKKPVKPPLAKSIKDLALKMWG